MRALSKAHFRKQRLRQLLSVRFRCAAYPQRAEHDVFQRRQVREQVKLLEHHARFLADQTLVDFRIVNFKAINN